MNPHREYTVDFPRNRAEARKMRSRELPRRMKVKEKLFKGLKKGHRV